MQTSLITPVWNHLSDLTKSFVESLLSQKGDFELIIVNNGSQDGTTEYLDSIKDKRLKVVHCKTNLGFGGGNNLGYLQARGEYICFLNNDIIFQPGWLDKLLAYTKDHPDTLCGKELVTNNSATLFRNKFIKYINGYCMFASKKLFDAIAEDGKVFDEGVGLAYFEDVELSYRAVRAGYKLAQVDTDLVHIGGQSSGQLNQSKAFQVASMHYHNKMMRYYLKDIAKKRIVFYLPESFAFIDSDYEGKGVGGSEAATINITRQLAKKGWLVEIYNNTTVDGVFGGVHYYHRDSYRPTDYCDVFVLCRNPYNLLPMVNAKIKIFWSCDQYTAGYWPTQIFPYVDKMICISEYHKDYHRKRYGIKKDFARVIELGFNAEDYEKLPEKIPGKLIYCSVPNRGLVHLARLFPLIKNRVPEATLVITSDYTLWGNDALNGEFPPLFNDGVSFLGKIPRGELVKHQLEAQVMAYPCAYEECFCISAMECIAAGAVPVTTDIAAMHTTVSDSGVLLSNAVGTPDYDTKFVEAVVSLLQNSNLREKYVKEGRQRAFDKYTWAKVADNWEKLINEIEIEMVDKIKQREQQAKTGGPKGYQVEEIKKAEEKINDILLRFTKPVEFAINGTNFSGKEVYVPAKFVEAAMQVCTEGYGPDIFADK